MFLFFRELAQIVSLWLWFSRTVFEHITVLLGTIVGITSSIFAGALFVALDSHFVALRVAPLKRFFYTRFLRLVLHWKLRLSVVTGFCTSPRPFRRPLAHEASSCSTRRRGNNPISRLANLTSFRAKKQAFLLNYSFKTCFLSDTSFVILVIGRREI